MGPFKKSLGAQTSGEDSVISSHLEGRDVPLAPKRSIIYEIYIVLKRLFWTQNKIIISVDQKWNRNAECG